MKNKPTWQERLRSNRIFCESKNRKYIEDFISTIVIAEREAHHSELDRVREEGRKEGSNAIKHFYEQVKYVADKDNKWVDGGHSISSGDLLTIFLESKRLLSQTALTQLAKDNK